MQRILFVDDEQNVLEGLRCRLRPFRSRWQMVFACGGEDALQKIDTQPFDVVVSDIRMPGIDGLGVLNHLATRQPSAARIVLSGETDVEVGRRLAAIAHQVLSKPCEPGRLETAIDRICGVRSLVTNEEIRSVVTGISQLPALSPAVEKLKRMLAGPEPALGDVAAVVQNDIALSAKTLHVASSSFFGLPDAIEDVQSAVRYLGLDVVRGLVRTVEVSQDVPGGPAGTFSPTELQRHSVLTARVATRVAGDETRDGAFIGGVLHDLGLLILARHFPERLSKALETSAARGVPLETIEAEVFGATHADIGAYLLGLWGLPPAIVEGVAQHHQLDQLKEPVPRELDRLAAIQIACALADEVDEHVESTKRTRCRRTEGLVEKLGMSSRLEEWRAMVLEEEAAQVS